MTLRFQSRREDGGAKDFPSSGNFESFFCGGVQKGSMLHSTTATCGSDYDQVK